MNNQKNKVEKIDDKAIFETPPEPNVPLDDTPNSSAQDAVSKDSYLLYSLKNRNQYCKISPNTKKTNMTPNTDAPNTDAYNAAVNDASGAPNNFD